MEEEGGEGEEDVEGEVEGEEMDDVFLCELSMNANSLYGKIMLCLPPPVGNGK